MDISEFRFGWLVSGDSSIHLRANSFRHMEFIDTKTVDNNYSRLRPIINSLRKNTTGDTVLSYLRSRGPIKYEIPLAPPQVELWKPDLIHFPTQYGFKTNLPNIYQPHDLQHLHLPNNFSQESLAIRNIGYKFMINQATKIVVGNDWTVRDIEDFFPITKNHVLNVPVFPQPLKHLPHSSSTFTSQFGKYFFYPAGDWPHKNHERLLIALRKLLDSGINYNLVLTGVRIDRSIVIKDLLQQLNLQKNVFIPGYVNEFELSEIYTNAQVLIVPSLFESESLPIWEGFAFQIPVIASNATAIPSQVGKAALLFNPESISEIFNTMREIVLNKELRTRLVSEGTTRLSKLTPMNTALGYRFAYRQALELGYDEEDKNWIEEGFQF